MADDRRTLKVFTSVLDMIPHIYPTPLVMLRSLSVWAYKVWAKLEHFNPFSHSIKDGPAWNISLPWLAMELMMHLH